MAWCGSGLGLRRFFGMFSKFGGLYPAPVAVCTWGEPSVVAMNTRGTTPQERSKQGGRQMGYHGVGGGIRHWIICMYWGRVEFGRGVWDER